MGYKEELQTLEYKGTIMKILLEAPILTQSGYGEHSRFVLRSILDQEGVEIYINPLNWGSTPWSIGLDPDLEKEIDKGMKNLHSYIETSKNNSQDPVFDIQVHVGIPSEFEKKAPYSVCVTAGIETDRVSAEWIVRTHKGIDKLVVPSDHAKSGFVKTSYEAVNNQTGQKTILECNCPVEVVPYPVKDVSVRALDFETTTDFNFLSVALLGARKNIENMVKWFVEEFKDENVGLILKTGRAQAGAIDLEFTERHFENLLKNYKDKKCKIYLLHGGLEESEIHSLYLREDVHAYVTSTHGEGFGLPLFEAAYSGLPIVATDWSAHTEFLTAPYKENGKVKDKKLFAKVDFELAEIPKSAVWKNILIEGSRWAYPNEASFKKQLRNVYKNHGMYKKWSKELQSHILEQFSEEKIQKLMRDALTASEVPVQGINLGDNSDGAFIL